MEDNEKKQDAVIGTSEDYRTTNEEVEARADVENGSSERSNDGVSIGKVRMLRITAIKGYLHKSVDLPVDEDGIKWLRHIFAMNKEDINVEGNGKKMLRVRLTLLHGDTVF